MYVKSDFLDVITKHGNLDALRFDDHVSLKPSYHGGSRDHIRKKNNSGIIITSKLSHGNNIVNFISKSNRGGFSSCYSRRWAIEGAYMSKAIS